MKKIFVYGTIFCIICSFLVNLPVVVFADEEVVGKTDSGDEGGEGISNYIRGQKLQVANDGQVINIGARIYCSSSGEVIKGAVYDASYNLLGESDEENVNTIASWYWIEIDFSSPVDVESGTYYYFCIWGSYNTNYKVDSDNTGGDGMRDSELYDGSFPDPFSYSYIDDIFCIYATIEYSSDSSPVSSNEDDNGVTGIGETVICSAYWVDDLNLDICYFSTNSTGSWVNSSVSVSGVSSWANKSFSLPVTMGVRVEYKWYCSDNASQWTVTSVFYLVTTDDYPVYSNVDDDGVTQVGETVTCSVYWSDNYALDICYFSTNVTGSWVNSSVSVSGASSWANKSFTLSYVASVKVGYMWYCNDTSDQWNSTSILYVTTTALSVTYYFNDLGGLYANGLTITNGTVKTYNYNQSVILSALPYNSSYVFSKFLCPNVNGFVNPYTWYARNGSVWCLFASVGSGSSSNDFENVNYNGLFIVVGLFFTTMLIILFFVFRRW